MFPPDSTSPQPCAYPVFPVAPAEKTSHRPLDCSGTLLKKKNQIKCRSISGSQFCSDVCQFLCLYPIVMITTAVG